MGDRVKNWEFRNYKNQDGTEKRELYINGEISEYDWWGEDCTTPSNFEKELYGGTGDVDMWVNSNGGDVFAAAKIYHSITQYKGGKITAYVYGLCASAASVIVMAASEIKMSPTALMLIHNPSTYAGGEQKDMEKASELLASVKETIINAYETKTKLSREKISAYMDAEKAFDATEAIELGFADGIIVSEQDKFSDIDVNNKAMLRFYNSVKDWKLAFQAKTETTKTATETKQEGSIMDENVKVPEVVDTVNAPAEPTEPTTPVAQNEATNAVVDVKDFQAVVDELRTYKTKTEKEISDLREYKAKQEAEIKAQDLVGLPGITDERRIELARVADEKLFEELKAIANTMNEMVKPVGASVPDEGVDENKEENDLRSRIKNYAAEKGISESEAYYAVVNGGK